MNRTFRQRTAAALLCSGIFCATSCVPSRQFDEMKSKEAACQDDKTRLQSQYDGLTTQFNDLDTRYKDLEKSAEALRNDTTSMGDSWRKLEASHEDLSREHDKLLVNHKSLMAGNAAETRRLIARLDSAQESLLREEDKIEQQRRTLMAMEDSLHAQQSDLVALRRMVWQRDSVATALKNAVSKALLGFENNGLTIEKKNGMVYVSLEERLLFASGSTVVDKKGAEALKGLSDVLARNKDIQVTVEGHTDNVPISGGPIKDNWDLSVLRATEVTKIITRNKGVDPSRISAAGRGPFVPVDNGSTAEAKRKNRRTEIILMPRYNELMKVVENRY